MMLLGLGTQRTLTTRPADKEANKTVEKPRIFGPPDVPVAMVDVPVASVFDIPVTAVPEQEGYAVASNVRAPVLISSTVQTFAVQSFMFFKVYLAVGQLEVAPRVMTCPPALMHVLSKFGSPLVDQEVRSAVQSPEVGH